MADDEVQAFMASRRVRRFPGLQAKRGRELCAALGAALAPGDAGRARAESSARCGAEAEQEADAGDVPDPTLGAVLSLSDETVRRLAGGAEVALLRRLGRGEDGPSGTITPRGLPKVLAAEVSFPPTDDWRAIER